jgi:hypothetical protein
MAHCPGWYGAQLRTIVGHTKARVCAAFNSMTLSILRVVVDACTLRHCNGCDNTEVVSLSRKGNVTLGVLDI